MSDVVRIRLLVAYDGSGFHGFAYQGAGVPTVAGAIRRALVPLVGYEPLLTVAGRTDAGVHAWGQVISFDVPLESWERFGSDRYKRSLNKQLESTVVVRDVASAEADFDARRSAVARRYRYTILTSDSADPFLSSTTWHVGEHLDLSAMNEGSRAILGEHDFSSFCRRIGGGGSLNRRVDSARWVEVDERLVRFDVQAQAFCHQMVRSLVGSLVDIGRGKRKPAAMAEILEARDRRWASAIAPPRGLCLWEVMY